MAHKQSVREAVAELRKRLDVDQTKFAELLGKSYPMARRYETEVPPHGEALAPFALLAEENGFEDLAALFREALIQDLPDVARVLSAKSRGASEAPQIPPAMIPLVDWLLDLFKEKGSAEEEIFKNAASLLAKRRSADLKRAREKKNPKS